MTSSGVIAAPDTRIQPIAPWWHTVLVLAPIAIGSVASAYQHGLPNTNLPGLSHWLSSYFTVLVRKLGDRKLGKTRGLPVPSFSSPVSPGFFSDKLNGTDMSSCRLSTEFGYAFSPCGSVDTCAAQSTQPGAAVPQNL